MSAEKERRDERQIVKQVQREVRKRQGTRWTHSPNAVSSSVAVSYVLECLRLLNNHICFNFPVNILHVALFFFLHWWSTTCFSSKKNALLGSFLGR